MEALSLAGQRRPRELHLSKHVQARRLSGLAPEKAKPHPALEARWKMWLELSSSSGRATCEGACRYAGFSGIRGSGARSKLLGGDLRGFGVVSG